MIERNYSKVHCILINSVYCVQLCMVSKLVYNSSLHLARVFLQVFSNLLFGFGFSPVQCIKFFVIFLYKHLYYFFFIVQPLLHTSWLSVVFRRGISHESITLVKWMTEQVLYLDFEACPMIQQGQDKVRTT